MKVKFNPEILDVIRTQIETVLEVLNEKWDVDIQLKTMRYEPDGSSFTASIKGAVKNKDGLPMDAHAKAYLKNNIAIQTGYDLFDEFVHDGDTWIIAGYRSRAKKKVKLFNKERGTFAAVSVEFFKMGLF
tara:strand:+ start:627 stop:1016 length:390 start_codon:yes stop_codon:yes gene_type:complete